ncbi:M64 family metallopeptidase [Isoptericola cucumis]|uniref:M64 family metallopeptidase n=1 Tax=Isoptericola cucumis TaxID=1776856 RepID=UPI00166A9EFC|nr:M64 family metallopeptidase [Isoptericola cucumis]
MSTASRRRRRAAAAVVAVATALATATGAAAATSTTTAQQAADDLPEWGEVDSARLVPLQETGDPSERLNIVVMCDGYTAAEQDACAADVERNQNVQWSVEPFRSYRHYVNVYRLDIVSGGSGIRCDPDEEGGPDPDKVTPLRLVFSPGCDDPLARGVVYNNANGQGGGDDAGATPTGRQQHDFYLENYVAPELGIDAGAQNLQTLAVFNSFTYGGIGGTQATTSGGSPQGPLVSLHELGHSLGQMADEYPYSLRPTPGDPHPDREPGSFHHTRMTSQQMTDSQSKWFRWLGEESLSGGTIRAADPDGHESGATRGSDVWRPSEHSIMRWLGFHWDQVGREHMVARLTGQRNAGQMSLPSTPEGEVPRDGVVWVDTTQPRFHELDVTWRVGGPDGRVLDTGGARSLDLAGLDLEPGTVLHVEARDPVGPDGLDWVRNPSTNNTTTDSGYNGPRFVQTRQWTVGEATAPATPPTDPVVAGSPTDRPLAADEVASVQTAHPADRVIEVAWELDGRAVDGTTDRTLDLGSLDLAGGTHELVATVTDPAGGDPQTLTWAVDAVPPTAPRTLSPSLASVASDPDHGVWFDEFDMTLEPTDDPTGYDGDPYVVGEFRLDGDGWFNYFGFPEQEDAPFTFSHSGKVVKSLVYGSLGSGGMSKAAFEQEYDAGDPGGPFVPGFGTHTVEHRAIDPAGNVGEADAFDATVIPGAELECDRTVSGAVAGRLAVRSGTTCLDGATVRGGVSVAAGASLKVVGSTVSGSLSATGAEAVQLFGSTVAGSVSVTGTTADVTVVGSTLRGSVALTGNTQRQANERYSTHEGAYGPVLVGNRISGSLACSGNSAAPRDFGAPNEVTGSASGGCAGL